jgi:hypothetical protein
VYLKRINWFEDRVDTFLARLVDWIESKDSKVKIDVASAVRAGIELVPVDAVWDFAVKEIARQLDVPPAELALPNRTTVEKAFFTGIPAFEWQ